MVQLLNVMASWLKSLLLEMSRLAVGWLKCFGNITPIGEDQELVEAGILSCE